MTISFRATGVSVQGVHNLTLSEINRAINSINGNNNRSDTDMSAGFKSLSGNATGLFDLHQLSNYGTPNYYYWLATPYSDSAICYVDYYYSQVSGLGTTDTKCGVRPVVVLSSSVELVDENNDGIFEIK